MSVDSVSQIQTGGVSPLIVGTVVYIAMILLGRWGSGVWRRKSSFQSNRIALIHRIEYCFT